MNAIIKRKLLTASVLMLATHCFAGNIKRNNVAETTEKVTEESARFHDHREHKKTSDANIIGHVKERASGNHLPYVTVRILGTTIATVTDHTGHYFFKNLPVGKHTLEVSFVGYETVQREVTVAKDKTIEENFLLEFDNVSLEEVVVSANRSATRRRLAPNLVSVVGAKLFETTQSTCLAEGLNFQPGVRTEDDCQNCGFAQVRINGLDGHYSQILIDSRPVFSALNGVYGLEQIPANMIERVEVVRGGGSALYGASAIGGTINVITKEPLHNTVEVGHTIMNISGSGSFDNITTANGAVTTDDHRAGIYVYGQSRNRQSYDHDGDGYTELPLMRNKTIGFNSFMRISPTLKLNVQYHGINEFRRGGNNLEQPAHLANVTEQTEHEIHGGAASLDYFSRNSLHHANVYFSFQHTDRNSYYGGIASGTEEEIETAGKAYGKTKDMTWVAGGQYVFDIPRLLFMPASFTAGIEYNRDALTDVILGYDRHLNQTTHISSVYVQNEWKNKMWSFLLGGRVDKHNLIDHAIFSPRVNVRYNPTENINLRATWSGGFRAPQAFDEDLHVGVVGGERLVTVLADNLKEERSNSFSLSADMYRKIGVMQANLLLEGFYTKLDNIFALRQLADKDSQGNIVQERYNAYGGYVAGVNIEGKLAYGQKMQVQGGVTLQRSRYDEAVVWNEEVPEDAVRDILKSPDFYGYLAATFTPVKRLSLSVTGNYTGRMLIGHNAGSGVEKPTLVKTPSFFAVNAQIGYTLPAVSGMNIEFTAGVKNLFNEYQKDFDQGWDRDSNYIYGPSTPRSVFLGVKIKY